MTALSLLLLIPAAEPVLATPASLGVVRGTKTTLTLPGSNLGGVTHAAAIGDGNTLVLFAVTDAEATKLTVTAEVPADAPIGLYQLRVAGPAGMSAIRPICVDSVPTVAKGEKNQRPADAQTVTWPCTIVGSIASETADFYRFTVAAGQTVTFDAFAKRLGSKLDPVLILGDAATGREYASLYADDTPGLQTDARLVHTFAKAGTYFVSIRDTTYKGGDGYDYRLRISEGPSPVLAYPPFATRLASKPADGAGPDAWPVPRWLSTEPPAVEAEPNDDRPKANRLPADGTTARFGTKADVDVFSFAAKKGEKWEVVAQTATIGSACEVLLKIQDGMGKTLAESDPQKPTARAEFDCPADGTYFAVCEHLNFAFGPAEVYHVRAAKRTPLAVLVLGSDRVVIPHGSNGLVPIVAIDKRNGFEGPAMVDGLPVSVEVSKERPIYRSVRAEPQFHPFATIRTPEIECSEVVRSGLNGLPHLPPGWGQRLIVGESPAANVHIVVPKALTVKPGATANVELTLPKSADATLTLLGLPANLTAKPATIKPGDAKATMAVVADAKASGGRTLLYVKAERGAWIAYAGPIALTIDAKPAEPKPAPPKKK
jgi:hypothetical protein